MKQRVETVETTGGSAFDREVNKLLDEGYKLQTTCISKRNAGTYDEYSLFQAILLKESD